MCRHCLARHAKMSTASRLAHLFRGQTRIALVATRTASTSAWSSPAMLHACRAIPPLVGTPPGVLPRAHRGLAAAGLAGFRARGPARGISCTSAASAARKEGGRRATPRLLPRWPSREARAVGTTRSRTSGSPRSRCPPRKPACTVSPSPPASPWHWARCGSRSRSLCWSRCSRRFSRWRCARRRTTRASPCGLGRQ